MNQVPSPLRVLLVEDSSDDAELVVRALLAGGLEVEVRVIATEAELLATLPEFAPEMILCDWTLPGFSGEGVVADAHAWDPGVPCILVSGTAGEELVVKALQSGATDYVLKSRLEALVPAIKRALAEGSGRREQIRLEAELASAQAARDRRVRERVLIAGALADLQVLPTAEATAHLICRQVDGLADIVSATLYIFTREGSALPLAFVRTDGAPVPIRPLPFKRSLRLRERAQAGPWVEAWVRRPWHPYDRMFRDLGVNAVGYAPIRFRRHLIGMLTIASAEESAISQITESLPALLEFAGFAGALIGPAVADLTEVGVIRERISQIIRDAAFRPVFQPIVDLATGTHLGYEALTRFSSGTAPDLVFADARAAGLEPELELATLAASISAAASLPPGAWLSVNVSPNLVTVDERLADLLRKSNRPLVLEVTEHVLVDDYAALRAAIGRIRPAVRVAVDDAGAGVASFSHIVELSPAFVKLDIGLVRGIDTDPTRRALMVGLLHFASESASRTIAEGVETDAELATLKELGVSLAQGHLLGRPAPVAEWAVRTNKVSAVRARRDRAAKRGAVVGASDSAAAERHRQAGAREDAAIGRDAIVGAPDDAAAEREHGIDPQTAETERLVAIGLFAGGIAHDFNNLLTSIHGYAELARGGVGADDPIRDDLDQVIASAERAAALASKLLAFTRPQILMPTDIDPAQVISALVPILGPLLGDDIRVRTDMEGSHAWIRADPTQLEQIIINLAVNARDAMPTGGTVTIAVRDLTLTDSDRPDPDPSGRGFVRISVSDTGIGMDEATKARIFDPFYTTKDRGKGTGLGLSTVSRIVAQSGGRLVVETALGKGSTFHVDLPLVGAVRLPAPRRGASGAQWLRSGVVLVVDDDPDVLEFARRSLERAGFTVLAADGAEEAITVAERWAQQIDVLLTDVAMPSIDGPELAALVRAQWPDVGVVFMSGVAEDPISGGGGPARTRNFLPKPFSVEALIGAVDRAGDAIVRERTST